MPLTLTKTIPNIGAYPFRLAKELVQTNMSHTWMAMADEDSPAYSPGDESVVVKIARSDQASHFRRNQWAIDNEEQWLTHLQVVDRGHPGIVSIRPIEGEGKRAIYSAKTVDRGRPRFLVVEHLAGGSLKQVVQRHGRLPVRHALHITKRLAESLIYVHGRGCVHLDIKHDNILLRYPISPKTPLTDIEPVLIDFGIAGPVGKRQYVGGAERWISPECRKALRRADKPVLQTGMDIFPLGLVLHYLITGQSTKPGARLAPITTGSLRKDPTISERHRELMVEELNALLASMTAPVLTARLDAVEIRDTIVGLLQKTVPLDAKNRRTRPFAMGMAMLIILCTIGFLLFPRLTLGALDSDAKPPSSRTETAVLSATTVATVPSGLESALPSTSSTSLPIVATTASVTTASVTTASVTTASVTTASVTTASATAPNTALTAVPTTAPTAVPTANSTAQTTTSSVQQPTSTPQPTPTTQSTATPQPTSTRDVPTLETSRAELPRAETSPSVQRNSQPTAAASVLPLVTIVQPAPQSEGRGPTLFEWGSATALPPDQNFEVAFWQPGQDPFVSAFGIESASKATSISVNLSKLSEQRPTLLMPNQEYLWSVWVVRASDGKRLQQVSEARLFYFRP